MNPESLSLAIAEIASRIVGSRAKDIELEIDDSVVALERPKNRDHGDWATSIAMKLAKKIGVNPRDVATDLVDALSAIDGIASVEIAGPGFLNITLDAAAAGEIARTVLTEGDRFGHN